MNFYSPQHWKDYVLLDTGDGEKLEKFGDYCIIRPEPAAKWPKGKYNKEWRNIASARYIETRTQSGKWDKDQSMPNEWGINYHFRDINLIMRLKLGNFKNIGVFPEQAANWDYIYDLFTKMNVQKPRLLNLFAYTGGASLAAKAAGADVYHVDSQRNMINWAKENMELSGLSDIRWVVEDVSKFVKRSIRKGRTFHGIILDPPIFGKGPNNESWKLNGQLQELLKDVVQLLVQDQSFCLLNLYTQTSKAL